MSDENTDARLVSTSSMAVGPGIHLGNDTLTTQVVARWARSGSQADVSVAADAVERMNGSVAVRDEALATGRPIYGVTTGFGDSGQFHLGRSKVTELQQNLITYHLNGTGPLAAAEVVRAAMLVRANCLARGYSGIRPAVVELLLACLRHGIVPLVPERGSVGASGDLVPLCYIAEMLMGGGDVDVDGRVMDAAVALNSAGLEPLTLQAKEGLALINGTSFMSGFGVLAAHDAGVLADVADLCTALTAEALLADRGHFAP